MNTTVEDSQKQLSAKSIRDNRIKRNDIAAKILANNAMDLTEFRKDNFEIACKRSIELADCFMKTIGECE